MFGALETKDYLITASNGETTFTSLKTFKNIKAKGKE
jgi:hypothetical protein